MNINKVLENIDIILKNDFYNDKNNLKDVNSLINDWYELYKKNSSLKGIDYKKIEYIQNEINDFVDKYLPTEPVKENHAERLSYNFGHLMHFWKSEMLGEKNK